jgi:ABC-type antimicrobial peptide transport system permease subunit
VAVKLNGLLPPLLLSAAALGTGVVLAVAVGLASGFLPGISAMRMRVVDALRRV